MRISPGEGGPSMGQHGPTWAGMLVLGLAFMLMSAIGFLGYRSMQEMEESSPFPDTNSSDLFCLMPAALFVLGLILFFLSFVTKGTEEEKARMDALAAEQAREQQQRDRELEMRMIVNEVKRTVKIRCRYCGILNDENAATCESCGAPL